MDKGKESSKEIRSRILSVSAIVGIIALVAGGIGGFLIHRGINGLDPDEQKLVDEYRTLKDEWLFGNEEEFLADYALSGLASGVASQEGDDFTFYTPTMEDQNLSVDHSGFGFSSRSYDGGLYLTEVHEGSAKKAGLRKGDVLYGVTRGEEPFYDFTIHSHSDVTAYIGSEDHAKEDFCFLVKRDSKRFDVTIRRSSFSENMVETIETPSSENGYTLTLRIPTFLGNPSQVLESTLKEQTGKSRIDRLVLDMRGNGGGYVSECEKMAKLFVRKGSLIYQMRDKNDKIIQEKYQTSDPKYPFDSYAILLDGNSASATETFAMAMRAGTDDCLIYGLPSYGKGIAQGFHEFADGSILRYTYAYVYSPEKENETMYGEGEDEDKVMCIHGKGIVPDVSFDYDYLWLSSLPSITDSIAVGEKSQRYVLDLLNLVDAAKDSLYTYNSDYHFTDAITDFANIEYEKYQESSLLTPFNDNGTVSLPVFNKIAKESYDFYLQYAERLLEETIDDR